MGFFCFLCLFKLFTPYWSIIDKQRCDSCRWTAKKLSHRYTCLHSPTNSPTFQAATNTEQSSLCYTDHFEYSSVYMSIPNSLTIPSNHSSCPSNHKFVLMVHSVSQKLVIFIICVLGIMVQKAFLFFKTIPFLFVHYFNITFDEFMNE